MALPVTAHAGELSGVVRDSVAQPVAGATVEVPELGLVTQTDTDGRYSFADVAAGEHRIAVEQVEGALQFASVTVPEQGTATRNVFLYPRRVVEEAATGVNPLETMLLDVLAAQAWEEASEMTAADAGEAVNWQWRDLDG
ncbi:carboxypeptidase regulatory-like domain-containing protein [Aurantiacibacter gilvus]|uniref:Carboxypeptidase regulatory-like domain-containing protein n=1 Tax=Aurantiacibacter gilvus TaxID=3139141 RepID=A0ABU9IGA1_9SPHN